MFGKLANGGEVHVSLKENALAFEMSPAPPKVVKKRVKKKGKTEIETPEGLGDEAAD